MLLDDLEHILNRRHTRDVGTEERTADH
jgi:hypothetical protein